MSTLHQLYVPRRQDLTPATALAYRAAPGSRAKGYHIFAAAIVAKFFPTWGVKHHEAVTLFIRDIANPSSADPFFPVFRHKVPVYVYLSCMPFSLVALQPTPDPVFFVTRLPSVSTYRRFVLTVARLPWSWFSQGKFQATSAAYYMFPAALALLPC